MVTTWKVTFKNRFGKKVNYSVSYGDGMTEEMLREHIYDMNGVADNLKICAVCVC